MTGSRLSRFFLAFLLVPALAGCALFESKATRALHASPDYKAGYSDGCSSVQASGSSADTRVRDDSAFAANAAYRAGWREGFGGCRMMDMRGGGPSMVTH